MLLIWISICPNLVSTTSKIRVQNLKYHFGASHVSQKLSTPPSLLITPHSRMEINMICLILCRPAEIHCIQLKAEHRVPIVTVLRTDYEHLPLVSQSSARLFSALSHHMPSNYPMIGWTCSAWIRSNLSKMRNGPWTSVWLGSNLWSLMHARISTDLQDLLQFIISSPPFHILVTFSSWSWSDMAIPKKEILVKPVRKIGRALSDGYYGASYIPDQSGQ